MLAGVLLAASTCPSLVLGAEVDSVIRKGAERVRVAQAAQDRVDDIVESTRTLEDQYRTALKEIEGLEVYNGLMNTQISGQINEIEELGAAIDQVTVIERQITPLMIRMIDGLEQFIALDVPFLLEEREERVRGLHELMERADVTVAEKFRRVTEAYQIEMDYGRTVLAYEGTLELDGGLREVNFLRVGRIGLYYQSADAARTGVWNPHVGQWQVLDSAAARNQVRMGIRVANKQVAPDLLLLPVPAPRVGS
ncbi:DUF3450 domain-containing protein [Thioalkalivibrio sp. XN8]|uniref:DUF3450 domain-containing protein n=1 Tax=Thioalkalivibrio sp. XN8 TaxID=2712863 RepID=UPI0013ED3775|nr:DUF3450 domain-containing protein [Thioalkalivibrio sp. XN8]NGP54206.1 DUF3450 domain-containing protein [Thioalkalivibrio sp. XN8]